MRKGHLGKVCWAVVLGALAGAIRAQPESAWQRTIARAVGLQRGGQWEEARSMLERGLRDCGTGAEAQACQSALHYAAAYCYEQWSQQAPGNAEPLLRRAERHYLSVLESQPAHGPTLNNLAVVYQRLGQMDRAIRLWGEAARNDPARAARYFVLMGGRRRRGAPTKRLWSTIRMPSRRSGA